MEAGKLNITNIFEKTARANTRFVFNEGGTRSGKTMATLQTLYKWAEANKNQNLIISVISETMPHLKRGAMLDFYERILKPAGLYNEKYHNKTDNNYKINGNTIEFFSADNVGKVHGPGRHILFFNELQNANFDTFFHLVQRTELIVYADWNPTHEFFVHKNFMNNPDYKNDITYIHSTYKDNPYLSKAIVKDILTRAKYDKNYEDVYVKGIIGRLEGVVFSNWEQIDAMPESFDSERYGMDFGFTNDPTTLIHMRKKGQNIYFDELLYETGLLNKDIISKIKDNNVKRNYDVIYADNAEPKSIQEIHNAGYVCKPANEAKKNINKRIDKLKEHKIFITKRSLNLIKELRNYTYLTDKDGNKTNKPIDKFNHGIDAMGYSINDIITDKTEGFGISF